MVLASLGSFYVNKFVSNALLRRQKGFQLGTAADESGLAHLHRFHRRHLRRQLAAAAAISRTRPARPIPNLWWVLAGIISCGTLAGPLIMEFTKIFVSTKSRHVRGNHHLPPARAARR